MTIDTWDRLARRHEQFSQLLADRLLQSESLLEQSTEVEDLAKLVDLYERLDRHDARMRRHLEKANLAVASVSRDP